MRDLLPILPKKRGRPPKARPDSEAAPRSRDPDFIKAQWDLKERQKLLTSGLEDDLPPPASSPAASPYGSGEALSPGVASPAISQGRNAPTYRLASTIPNNAVGLITFYNLMYHARGFSFPPHLQYPAFALSDPRIKKLLIVIGPGSGKALHPDTKVLTKRGWLRMGALTTSDFVMIPDGKTWVKVRGVFEQPLSRLYRLNFADGCLIRANGNHLWKVYNKDFKLGNVDLDWRIRTTEEICLYKHAPRGNRVKWYVQQCSSTYNDLASLEIMSIHQEAFESPSVCINIDHPAGLFVIENNIVTHNSALLSTVFPAYMLGQVPDTTIVGISAGEALMQGFMSAVMEWVEHAPGWKAAFPQVLPDKGRGWSTERGMFVSGHAAGDPDASYLAAGLSSKRLTGVHARIIIGDDLHDKENSSSAEACKSVRDTFYSQILGRADPRGARFIFAGRRWHDEDIYGHLKRTGEWVVMELPNIREKADYLYWDVTIPEGLECVFTEMMRGEHPACLGIPKSEDARSMIQAVGFENVGSDEALLKPSEEALKSALAEESKLIFSEPERDII